MIGQDKITKPGHVPRASSRPWYVTNPIVEDSAQEEMDQIVEDLGSFEFDPLGFVLWAYPWGEAGTTLAEETGPEPWQAKLLETIGEKLRAGMEVDLGAVVREAATAGHGVGKSALVSWLIHWAISTHEDTRGVVTANTETQLRTKTWAELSKWNHLFIARDFFTLTATAIYCSDPAHAKTWRIDQIPWSAERSESFAGLHNKGKRIIVIFDEASAIDDIIWEVTEGALTDKETQIMWFCFGNPTRASGRFHKETTRGKRFSVHRVDSREVKHSNKAQIQEWIDDYGEDSDFVRVRVRGLPPMGGTSEFIGFEVADKARQRRIPAAQYAGHPKIMAIDPARFGDDETVITLRQGYKVLYQVFMSGFDGPDVAGRVVELCRDDGNVSCVAYDAIGIGADLDSSLKRCEGLPQLIPVAWGAPAKDAKQYFNQRSEAWGKMRDWLAYGQIPDDDKLIDQLTGLQKGFSGMMQIQLESKKDAKKRGVGSPDRADSLAISFVPELIDMRSAAVKAKPVTRRKVVWSKGN